VQTAAEKGGLFLLYFVKKALKLGKVREKVRSGGCVNS
jgi:hypothetical protein